MASPVIEALSFQATSDGLTQNVGVGQGPNRAMLVVEASTADAAGIDRHDIDVAGLDIPFINATDSDVDYGQTSVFAVSGAGYDLVETDPDTLPEVAVTTAIQSGHVNFYKMLVIALANVDTSSLLTNITYFEGNQYSETLIFDPISYEAGDFVLAVGNYTQDRTWLDTDNGLNGLALVQNSSTAGTAASSVGIYSKFATQDETNIVHTITFGAGPNNPGGNPDGVRKTGVIIVIKGLASAVQPSYDAVEVVLGNDAVFTRSAGGLDFLADPTHLVLTDPDGTEFSVAMSTATTLTTSKADLEPAQKLNQINIATYYTARLEVRTGEVVDEVSADFTFIWRSDGHHTQFLTDLTVAELEADIEVTPGGVAADSLALTVQLKGQVPASNTQPGDTLWITGVAGMTVDPTSQVENIPDGTHAIEYREYQHATKTWLSVLPVNIEEEVVVAIPDLTGDIVITPDQDDQSEANYSNPLTKQEPPTQLQSDANGCISPIVDGSPVRELFQNADGSDRLFYASRIKVKSRVFNPSANENAGPYIRTAVTGHGIWAHIGSGDTLTLERIAPDDSREGILGVTLDPGVLPTVAGEFAEVELEFFEGAAFGGQDGWRILIDDVVVLPAPSSGEEWWRDTTGSDPQIVGPFETGRIYLRENTLNACGGQMAATGFGAPPAETIVGIDGSAPGVIQLGQPVVITWSGAEHSASYTVIDVMNRVIGSYPAAQTGANEDTIGSVDITNARYGPVRIIADDNAQETTANYPPPAGRKAVTFGAAISTPATTAQWQPGDQIDYAEITDEGDAVDVLESGHTLITGPGAYPQKFAARRHDGTSWQALDDVYFFKAIEGIGAAPNQSHAAGTQLSLDFAPYFNSTKDLPPGEIGRTGHDLTVELVNPSLDMSLSGFVVTMSAAAAQQVANPTLRVTDPADNVADQTIIWSVTATADITPPVWDVVPTGVGTITFDSFSLDLEATDAVSATVNFYLAVAPVGDVPTAANIRAGVQSDGVTPLLSRGDAAAIPSGDPATVTAGGLPEGQAASLFAVAEDESGNLVLQSLGDFQTNVRQNPTFDVAPTVVARDTNSITVRVEVSDAESGVVDLFVGASAPADLPSDQNIVDNVQSDGVTALLARAEIQDVPNGESRDLVLAGLSPSTDYRVKVVGRDHDA